MFPRTVKGFLISSREPKNALDQFPRTNGTGFCLFTVTGQYPDINQKQSSHVETVVLITKGGTPKKTLKQEILSLLLRSDTCQEGDVRSGFPCNG